jgi:DNA-binding XRE family transcriptional regulator
VPGPPIGIVLFGDVIQSRRAGALAGAGLRSLAAELDAAYGRDRLARFGFTQGDELQGLLAPTADPFTAILLAALRPEPIGLRWAIAGGPIDPGRGPATQRTGGAFVRARDALMRARGRRDDLVAETGDPDADALLDDVAPLLAVLLGDLSDRQRLLARLLLVERLRKADAADRLGVSRATVSVLAERGRVREIERLARALGRIVANGVARSVAALEGLDA